MAEVAAGSGDDDKYAIHAASREGRLAAVESLLAGNAKLRQQRDADDRLPVHWASAYNHLAIVKVLADARSFDADTTDGSGWTSLMMAASLKEDAGLETVGFLLAKEADPKLATTTGATALHFAASKGNVEVCRTLLKHGASARAKDRRAQLALHRAAAAGSVPIVRLLLDEGKSPINGSDTDGLTALHHAVSEGHGDVAVELLKRGAESDRKEVDGRTALECAPDGKVRAYIIKAAEREGIDLES
ncbi:hypothetical protein DV736_g2390, partial [Chaetothyriales sp. CBS 134916]